MTKRERFELVIAMVNGAELSAEQKIDIVEGMNHEIELLNRKGTSPRKPSATQIENAHFKEVIVQVLVECGERKEIAELIPMVDSSITPNRMSALLSALVKADKVARIKEGKKTYFVAL